MKPNWKVLVENIQSLKSSVEGTLNDEFKEFNDVINEETSYDIANSNVLKSDFLFWHDPETYFQDHESWQNDILNQTHDNAKNYLIETDQKNDFYLLVQSIKKKRVAPFVGAGLSAPCKYPLWGTALKKFLNHKCGYDYNTTDPVLLQIAERIDAYDYIEAAQLISAFNRSLLDAFISREFSISDDTRIVGPLNILPEITDGCVITTNFDELIEKCFANKHRPFEGYMHGIQTQNQFAAKLIQSERCILKLHGHYNSPSTYIFSKDQYNAAYGDSTIDYTRPIAKVLRQIFVSHSLLFLGCSLELDRTLELFRDVVNSSAFDVPNHFAFLPEISDTAKRIAKESLLSSAQIRPIWYKIEIDSEGKQDHSMLEELLAFAVACAQGKVSI